MECCGQRTSILYVADCLCEGVGYIESRVSIYNIHSHSHTHTSTTQTHIPVLSCPVLGTGQDRYVSCYVAAAKRSRRPVRGMKQNSYWSPQCGIMPLVCSYALLALPCCGTTCCKHCTGWLLSVHTPASASLPCTYGASCHTPF